jgi:hypothetical protein
MNWIKFSWAWGKRFFATLHREEGIFACQRLHTNLGA